MRAGAERDLITAIELAHNMVTISSTDWGIYSVRCMMCLDDCGFVGVELRDK